MRQALSRLWNRLLPGGGPGAEVGEDRQDALEWVQEVERARRELLAARHYFENVTDRALVDHAIAVLDAAEKKYVYLLRRGRTSGKKAPVPPSWTAPSV